ncbi:hypothetical protein Csa_010767, partial [Cucumis sativus]
RTNQARRIKVTTCPNSSPANRSLYKGFKSHNSSWVPDQDGYLQFTLSILEGGQYTLEIG